MNSKWKPSIVQLDFPHIDIRSFYELASWRYSTKSITLPYNLQICMVSNIVLLR